MFVNGSSPKTDVGSFWYRIEKAVLQDSKTRSWNATADGFEWISLRFATRDST